MMYDIHFQDTKIGIAKRPRLRLKNIDSDVEGGVRLLAHERVFFARRCEKYLHRLFSDKRISKKRGGRQAGRTEWFELSWLDRVVARLYISFFAGWPYLFLLLVVFVVLVQISQWMMAETEGVGLLK